MQPWRSLACLMRPWPHISPHHHGSFRPGSGHSAVFEDEACLPGSQLCAIDPPVDTECAGTLSPKVLVPTARSTMCSRTSKRVTSAACPPLYVEYASHLSITRCAQHLIDFSHPPPILQNTERIEGSSHRRRGAFSTPESTQAVPTTHAAHDARTSVRDPFRYRKRRGPTEPRRW
ncbi:hypothetical protein BU26DRAFT_288603 [Trematosphaeria pertusa]|uniref:Uncharacterized protein n=1 Tax=Trematosphaeria pertusa TaxID=390896 RepID=A0A6A6IGK4_9PLEO|nr:uncharacterized protein BU26DRAFT_288603 [Trematosphaeria pertusa]KAF2249724.1 hypothetical protein BU26DRAFT_288603 [Trematosphaeria pertusa]